MDLNNLNLEELRAREQQALAAMRSAHGRGQQIVASATREQREITAEEQRRLDAFQAEFRDNEATLAAIRDELPAAEREFHQQHTQGRIGAPIRSPGSVPPAPSPRRSRRAPRRRRACSRSQAISTASATSPSS